MNGRTEEKGAGAVAAPEILLPAEGTDMAAWAVIACDQHTSDEAYWQALDEYVGDKPSTLRLMLPEIYLDKPGCGERVSKIAAAMREYRRRGVFRKLPKGYILVERSTAYSPRRTGVVLSVDLDAYSYEKKSAALIRATEATILERIPPRLQIREAASLEFPHAMLLYDDPQDEVLGPYKRAALQTVYDFDLNMGGGHVTGKFIPDDGALAAAFSRIERDGLLFMVGDGNHSLATAKAAWEKIKADLGEEERRGHPARYALCEAVNIYDEGIRFEAIHRIVKGVDAEKFAASLRPSGTARADVYVGGEKRPLGVSADVPEAVAGVDAAIARYLAQNGGTVDYIHGEEALAALTAADEHSVGIALPKMDKAQLFGLVKRGGSLPRKTFSMGESEEKRYYLEGKEIRVCD